MTTTESSQRTALAAGMLKGNVLNLKVAVPGEHGTDGLEALMRGLSSLVDNVKAFDVDPETRTMRVEIDFQGSQATEDTLVMIEAVLMTGYDQN